tara:strand:+ start:5031 stop:5501 length:471 start_codon:yes stop_codon:yes gene_type:complete
MISYTELGHIRKLLETEEWGAILIDKRAPVTRRLFIQRDDKRYCLHYMRSGKTKPHPHKYNVRVRILAGRYKHHLYLGGNKLYSEHMTQGSGYEINDPLLFHQVEIEPQAYCWSLMINDYDFDYPHPDCISTAGNDLQPIEPQEKAWLMKEFRKLL